MPQLLNAGKSQWELWPAPDWTRTGGKWRGERFHMSCESVSRGDWKEMTSLMGGKKIHWKGAMSHRFVVRSFIHLFIYHDSLSNLPWPEERPILLVRSIVLQDSCRCDSRIAPHVFRLSCNDTRRWDLEIMRNHYAVAEKNTRWCSRKWMLKRGSEQVAPGKDRERKQVEKEQRKKEKKKL